MSSWQVHEQNDLASKNMGKENEFKFRTQVIDVQQNRMGSPIYQPIN